MIKLKKIIILISLFFLISGCVASTHTFHLTWEWNGNAKILAGYNVYRQNGKSKDFIKVNKYPVHEKKYDDIVSNYDKNTIYCYMVLAIDKDGKEAKSEIKCSVEEDIKN